MERDLAKRFVTKDGKQRIAIYYEEYADNPRYNTDEPLHCEDWSREYSIMNKSERESKSYDACKLIRYLLARYGDNKKIIKLLKDNYRDNGHDRYENGLSYDRSRKEWVVYSWQPSWKDYSKEIHEAHWAEEWSFNTNIYDVDIYNIVDVLSDEQIDILCDSKYWTDGVKIASYSFGYYGEVSFCDEVSCDSEGIAWLEKDEFLNYSGCTEDYWKGKTLQEIEFLIDEIEAWSNNEVYGYVVEDAVRVITNVRYPDGEHDDTEKEGVEWEETESCWGYYGKLDKSLEWILEGAGFKRDELIEEKSH